MSDREIYKREDTLDYQLSILPKALARGNITVIKEELDELLSAFQLNVDRKSVSYRRLGRTVLAAHVRALKDIERRNSGEPVETPTFTHGNPGGEEAANAGGTLRDALSGWSKHRVRPAGTVHEYTRTVEMFIQQHGAIAVSAIRKSHAREFVQAAQLVPRARSGQLRNATLPVLNEWVQKHPEAPRVSVATVNKQIGAMQAITGWAHHHGIIPEEMPWLDPFSNMKIEEERSERGPFDARELQQIFDAPLFTSMEQPEASQGATGVWLPLLALFTGARRAELAGLRADNVWTDEEAGTALISIVAERRAGKRVKTRSSERVVPVHRELIKLGFLEYVAGRRIDGEQAWLFANVAPDQPNAIAVWGKWFSRYLRSTVGISDPNKVFHSFRHKFSDGATRAGVSRELRQALMGHSDGSVSAGYGSEAMLERFGAKALADAMSKISYPGLDLSRVKPLGVPTSTRGTKKA